MNYTLNRRNISLISRNEGKIKSYESCRDVRAWSHDVRVRGRYLREWIKCDMPICFLPVCTLTEFLKIMTYRNRGKTTPRCHPDCKSKVLLESICKSCHVMKEVLKDNDKFNKYIAEEEFETSHWPCERCLDALKSIKIFWKIVIEKIFNIHIAKNDEFEESNENSIRLDGVKSVAKVWEKDMVQQAMFIKDVVPMIKESSSISGICKEHPVRNVNLLKNKYYHLKQSSESNNIPKACGVTAPKARKFDAECNTSVYSNKSYILKRPRKLSRSISVRVKNTDIGCSTCNMGNEYEELKTHKTNVKYLQDKVNVHKIEIERLQQENLWLKCELQNSSKSYCWKSAICTPKMTDPDKDASTIKSIKDTTEGQVDNNLVNDIDSEMIITMKNCQNKSFKHVSVLQVLHKTNDPIMDDMKINKTSCMQEDPINLLTKVQTTFGAIVKREMSLASEKQTRLKRSDIEATFRRVNASKSVPSCSSISTSSQSNFVSTKDMSDRIEQFDVM